MQHDGFLRTKVFLCVGGNDIMLQALYLSLDETTTGHSAYISRYHNTIVFHYMLFVYIRVYIVLCYIFFLERYLRYFLYNSGRPNFLLKIFYPFFPFYRITRMNHKRYRIIYSLRLKNRTFYKDPYIFPVLSQYQSVQPGLVEPEFIIFDKNTPT